MEVVLREEEITEEGVIEVVGEEEEDVVVEEAGDAAVEIVC